MRHYLTEEQALSALRLPTWAASALVIAASVGLWVVLVLIAIGVT